MGSTCKPKAVSFQCMTKFTTKNKKEYWSGLPFPSPGDLPDPRDWTLDQGFLPTRAWLESCLLQFQVAFLYKVRVGRNV